MKHAWICVCFWVGLSVIGCANNSEPGDSKQAVLKDTKQAVSKDTKQPASKEEAAIELLRKKGANIQKFDEPHLPKGELTAFLSAQFYYPEFTMSDLTPLKDIDVPLMVSIGRADITDDDLVKLCEYDRIERLSLGHLAKITDIGLGKLGDLRNLKELRLSELPITGEGLKGFSRSKLTYLKILMIPVGDLGMNALAEIPLLEELDLPQWSRDYPDKSLKFTDDGVKSLQKLISLKNINLRQSPIADEGVKALCMLARLESLDISGSRVTDEGVGHLAGLSSLKTLGLGNTAVGNAGLAALSSSKSLESLGLARTQVNDEGLRAIGRFSNLKSLSLSHTAVSDDGLAHLRTTKLSDLELILSRLTDKGLEHLQHIKTLKTLVINDVNGQCSPEAIRRLKAALPDLKIPSIAK